MDDLLDLFIRGEHGVLLWYAYVWHRVQHLVGLHGGLLTHESGKLEILQEHDGFSVGNVA
jgi:hypothetical protein